MCRAPCVNVRSISFSSTPGSSATTLTSVFVSDNDIAYVTSANYDGLFVFDVEDSSNVIMLDNIKCCNLRDSNDVFVVGNIAYVVATTDESLSTFEFKYTQLGNIPFTKLHSRYGKFEGQ